MVRLNVFYHAQLAQRKLGQILKEWTDATPTLLKRMLEVEAQAKIPGVCESCAKAPALYRCRECAHSRALCQICLANEHSAAPLHWVEEWNPQGGYFERRDLSGVGLLWYLGHSGNPCPHLSKTSPPNPTPLTVTHTNGIHMCNIVMCRCPSYLPFIDQLLLAQLFPGTLDTPRSAYTFEVMTDAHLDTLTSKKSAYDYVRKLRRRTDNWCPHSVKVRLPRSSARHGGARSPQLQDRYREFMIASRFWRHLQMLKRCGWAHGLRYPNGPEEDVIVFRCLACPWPKVNLPEDWAATSEKLL